MKCYETVRLFGETVNEWKYDDGRVYQREIRYREYALTGELVATGTMDLQPPALRGLDWVQVWTWDGVRRNAGGYRWWEYQKDVRCRHCDRRRVLELMRNTHPDAEAVSVRKVL